MPRRWRSHRFPEPVSGASPVALGWSGVVTGPLRPDRDRDATGVARRTGLGTRSVRPRRRRVRRRSEAAVDARSTAARRRHRARVALLPVRDLERRLAEADDLFE